MASDFEAEIGRLMREFNTPGLGVEMLAKSRRYKAHAGRLAADGTLPVTEKTRFGTVCMIKLLIAINVLQMAEAGQIGLDNAIADHLPELGEGPRAKGRLLTIRHLLSHTGGFRSFTVEHLLPKAHDSWENCVKLLHDTEQMFQPGTVFNDEHLSHIILGQMIERLKRRPFLDVIRDEVLAPLKITPGDRTRDEQRPEIYAARHAWNAEKRRWEPEPDTYTMPDPAFGAISNISLTSGDMLKLGEALLADSASFSSWLKDRLFEETASVPRTFHPARITRWHVRHFGLGMATFRDGHRGVVTTGRGQNACIIFDKDRKSVLALAMNSANVLEREAVLNNLFAKFARDSTIVPESRLLDIGFDEFIAPFSIRDIGGVYLGFQPDPVEIFANPRGFVLRIKGEDHYRFEATPENRMVMRARLPTSVGLFPDPASQHPCLMMAMNAFKKVR
jgi:CubicO group peptidase (beta-lactamase class C family)